MDAPSKGAAEGEVVMKEFDMDVYLIKARPAETPVDTVFTRKVMRAIGSGPFEAMAKDTAKKSPLFRLRHLPKFAVVIIAVVALFAVSGVTYAVVETIKAHQNIKVEKSGVNSHGREELKVAFDSCAQQKKNGTTYELKKDSGLSAEDAANVLQAKCERDNIAEWVKKDPVLADVMPKYGPIDLRIDGFVGTFRGLSDAGMHITSATAFYSPEQDQTLPFPTTARD